MKQLVSADEARVLREAATPGPWSVLDDGNTGCRDIRGTTGDTTHDTAFTPGLWDDDMDAANARLIAAAPDLAATVEALHAECAALRRQVGELTALGVSIHKAAAAAMDAERDAVVAWLRENADEMSDGVTLVAKTVRLMAGFVSDDAHRVPR